MENSKKTAKYIISALLCTLFLVYITFHIINAFREKTALFTVTRITEENTLELSGFIFRDETVIYSGSGAFFSYNVKDGAKVRKESPVATLYFTNSAHTDVRLDELKSKIRILEESAKGLTADISALDAEITKLRTKIAFFTASGSTASIEKADEELAVLLHKRTLSEQNKDSFKEELLLLKTELSLITSSLATQSKEVSAPKSGYFYSYTDGLEESFTAEAAKNITEESFDTLAAMRPAQAEGAAGKIAAGGKWYFVCKTTIEECEEVVSDTYYACRFCDNAHEESVPMLLENKLIDYQKGTALLVFSSSAIPDDFDFSRHQRMKLTIGEISGIRVPASSVRVIDGQTSVYIMKEGVCRVRKVNILFEKNSYFIVSLPKEKGELAVFDRIILDDNDLFDGKVID